MLIEIRSAFGNCSAINNIQYIWFNEDTKVVSLLVKCSYIVHKPCAIETKEKIPGLGKSNPLFECKGLTDTTLMKIFLMLRVLENHRQ